MLGCISVGEGVGGELERRMGARGQQVGTAAIEDMDTLAIDVRVGGHVRCIMGALKGVEGVVTATRTGGRLLIRVAMGMYLEVPRICVRVVGLAS